MELFKKAILVSSILALAGCATMFGENNRIVRVSSNPAQADVYFNGMKIGTTPFDYQVEDPTESNLLVLKKDGYENQMVAVKKRFQKSFLLNVFAWPGFIVDYVNHNSHDVAPQLGVSLAPKGE